MKISVKDYGMFTNYDSIEEYVESKLSGGAQHIGVIESAEADITKVTEAMGRLMDVLAEKGILGAENVAEIIEDYADEVKFGEVL